jgi:hypothetical protein
MFLIIIFGGNFLCRSEENAGEVRRCGGGPMEEVQRTFEDNDELVYEGRATHPCISPKTVFMFI